MMRYLLALLTITVLTIGCDSDTNNINCYPQSGQYGNQLTVTGNGRATAEPDLASVTFGVDLSAEDPAEAVSEAAARVDSALAAASAIDVAEEDIHTSSYSMWIEPVYDPVTYEETDELAYHVSHRLTAKVRNMDRVGEFLAAVVEAGANTVSGVSFSTEDRTELLSRARRNAVNNAGRKARELAGELGLTLGPAINVSEYTSYYPTDYGYGDYYDAMGEPAVSPGAFSVGVDVTVTFEIEE